MSTTENAAQSDVPRQPLGDRIVWYFVRLFRIDQKAEKAVQALLERERGER
jgi:hypothetical protein